MFACIYTDRRRPRRPRRRPKTTGSSSRPRRRRAPAPRRCSQAGLTLLPRSSRGTHGGTQEGAHGLLTACSQDTHASGTHGGTRRCSQQEGSHGLGTHGVLTVTLSASAPYACSLNHRRKPDSRLPRGVPMGMGAHRVLEGILWSVQDPNVVRMLHLGSF